MQVSKFSAAYRIDNGLNPFGDYNLLVREKSRRDADDPGTTSWRLEGPNVRPLNLTEEQFQTALLNFFMQRANWEGTE